MISFDEFKAQFNFTKKNFGLIGVEREAFLSRNGSIAPIAEEVLQRLTDRARYGYELSACQLEDRVGPVHQFHLMEALLKNEEEIKRVEKLLGFERLFDEVAPASMPLDIYPDPSGRYKKITKNMPQNILSAACRVIGTHGHIGIPDADLALRVYNDVISHCWDLCQIGDGSFGERLRLYKMMAPDHYPPHYESWKHFYNEAVKRGFAEDPRKCWHLIRISKHGTIEFRMFGATRDLERIVTWAKRCLWMCSCTWWPDT